MNAQNRKWLSLVILGVLVLLAACGGGSKPVVSLNTGTSGTLVENQDVAVLIAAADNKGITRVELAVDNTIVSVANVNPAQKTANTPLTWKAVSGQHTLTARALNVDNVLSEPATMQLNVAPAPAPTVAPTLPPPTAAPTLAPTQAPATATALPPTPAPCVNNVAFVADVTVPDGSPMAMNQGFTKIWRVRNAGTCAWNAGYQFVYTGGALMSSVRQITVPNTNPGATADLAVTMVAPAAPNTYISNWQMHDASGKAFGPVFYANIRVLNPNPPPQPTAVPPVPVTRFDINGAWSAGNYSFQLNEAFGCGGATCAVSGSYAYWSGGTPDTRDVQGTVNINTGAVSLTMAGAMPGQPALQFTGALSANSRALSGTLSGVGALTFTKQ